MFGRSKPKQSRPELRRAPMRLLPLGQHEHLVELLVGGTARVSNAEAQLLAYCTRFETLDAHTAQFAAGTGADSAQARQLLEALLQAGLLLERGAFFQAGATAPAATISTTSIITAHRPQAALRCATSVTETARAAGITCPLLVVDDSDRPEQTAALRGGLVTLAAVNDAPVRFVTRDDKRAWAKRLAQRLAADVPTHVLEDALINQPGQQSRCGTNRNLQQLALPGQSFVSLDDDTLCRFYPTPGAQNAHAVCGFLDPTQTWHHAARDAVWKQHAGHDQHPAVIHAPLIGTGLADWLPESADLNHLSDVALHALTGGRIRASMTGVAGDSGMASGAYLMSQDGPGLDRLLHTEAHYASTRFGRNLLRACMQPIAARGPLFMGTCTAYDNTGELPPYLPIGRNADGVFGVTLQHCDSRAWIGYAPTAIHHDPPEPRPREIDRELAQPGGLHHSNLLCALIHQHQPDIGTPANAMVSLGHRLLAVTQDEDAFAALVRQLAMRNLAAQVRNLEAILDRRGAQPDWWAQDIEALRSTAVQASLDLDAFLFPTLGATPHARFANVCSQWRSYGQLLIHWPAIRAAAAAAIAKGDHPGALL